MANIYALLKENKISYKKISHPPLYTVEDTKLISDKIEGVVCKNLFLKDEVNRFYLITMDSSKKLDFKALEEAISVHKLHFASEKELWGTLNLTPGSVSPLGLLNKPKVGCQWLVEDVLLDKKIVVHSKRNVESVELFFSDLAYLLSKYNRLYKEYTYTRLK